MAIPFNTLLEESKCYLCLGVSQAEALELALLNRIAEGGGGGGDLPEGTLIYRALITQVGVAAPTSAVLQNTLAGTPVWTYIAPGTYRLTLAGAFPSGRTFLYLTFSTDSGISLAATVIRLSDNQILVLTGPYDNTGTYSDSILDNFAFQILVYP